MAVRMLVHLRPALVVWGHLVALVLLVLDARREWSAYGLVMLVLLLGALAVIPAALVDSPGFRLISLVAQTVGAGVVALALHDSADKRALWVYALSALVAVISPISRPGLGRTTVIGVGTAVVLTIGVSAPALAWGGSQPEAMVCVRQGSPLRSWCWRTTASTRIAWLRASGQKGRKRPAWRCCSIPVPPLATPTTSSAATP